MIGLVVAGTLTYIAASQQINVLEQSVAELRKDISKISLPSQQPTSSRTGTPVKFTLGTIFTDKGYRWVGKSDLSGENPKILVRLGQSVTIEIVNEDGVEHDLVIPSFGVKGKSVVKKGDRASITLVADRAGVFEYYCNIPGHKETGMLGTIVVEGGEVVPSATTPTVLRTLIALPPPRATTVTDIARSATAIPPPVKRNSPATVEFLLETREVVAKIAENSTYAFWTYNGTVPGPLLRVREGDTVVVRIKNLGAQPHSIDLHAVNGPGGGAVLTQTPPGGETSFKFKALNPGAYIYHCASPHIPTHVANGLYGIILVEPQGGLPPVDREFYVVQGDFYTSGSRGQVGHHSFDSGKALIEQAEYVLFNGRLGALTGSNAMKAKVGETIRLYFGNGGPNLASSFHVIGEVFDRVYPEGGLGPNASADINAETITVPPGSATIVEFKMDVPGRYLLVDHAIFRAIDKGAVAILEVEGLQNPEVFSSSSPSPTTGGH